MSLFPSRGIPRRYLFSVVLRVISPRFPDLEARRLKTGPDTFIVFLFKNLDFHIKIFFYANEMRSCSFLVNRDINIIQYFKTRTHQRQEDKKK